MISSIRATILAWWRSEHQIRCRLRIWNAIVDELARRADGRRESGAFLLGRLRHRRREVLDAVYYDDLAPGSLAAGAILFPGSAYGALWRICRERELQVVADVHTHPGLAVQSPIDGAHPMIAETGHIALILPRSARRPFGDGEIGIYEYLGRHTWKDHSGPRAQRIFLRTS